MQWRSKRYKAAVNAQTNSASLRLRVSAARVGTIRPETSLAGRKSPDEPGGDVEQLMRENAELKKTVEQLHREIERLKAAKG